MNIDRHLVMDNLKNMTARADDLTDQRDSAINKCERLQYAIEDSEATFAKFKYDT